MTVQPLIVLARGIRMPMMDIGGWLQSLGLERYEATFCENEIDETVSGLIRRRTLKATCEKNGLICRTKAVLPKARRW